MGIISFPRRRISLPSLGPLDFPGLTTTYINKVMATGPLALWPGDDATGTVARELVSGWNGTYKASGVTLGQAGIGDGSTVPAFVGAYLNIYTANLAAAFSFAEGGAMTWLRYTGSWTDGAYRYGIRFGIDGSNEIGVYKTNVNNLLRIGRWAQGVFKGQSYAISDAVWHCAGLKWSIANNYVYCFLDGVMSGPFTGGLAVVGSMSSSSTCIAAANTSSGNPFTGMVLPSVCWASPPADSVFTSLAIVP